MLCPLVAWNENKDCMGWAVWSGSQGTDSCTKFWQGVQELWKNLDLNLNPPPPRKDWTPWSRHVLSPTPSLWSQNIQKAGRLYNPSLNYLTLLFWYFPALVFSCSSERKCICLLSFEPDGFPILRTKRDKRESHSSCANWWAIESRALDRIVATRLPVTPCLEYLEFTL